MGHEFGFLYKRKLDGVNRPLDHFYFLTLDKIDIMPGIEWKQEN